MSDLETAEVNFIPFHIKVTHDKMVAFLQALGLRDKVQVTIKGQTSDFLYTNL